MKRSVRDFFLTLLVSVVIFAVAAFSLIGIAEGLMSDVVDKIDEAGVEGSENTTETSETSAPAGGTPSQGVDPGASTKDRCVSFLVVGLDRQHNHAENAHDEAFFVAGPKAAYKNYQNQNVNYAFHTHPSFSFPIIQIKYEQI